MRRFVVLGSAMIAASALGGGALAFQIGGAQAPSDEPIITGEFGEERAGLSARVEAAADAGPNSVTCEPGQGETLVCTEISDEEAIEAVIDGQTAYARNVISFGTGAQVNESHIPLFESSALVCGEPAAGAMQCLPVTVAEPTIEAGADVFVYYQRMDVTLLEDGTPVFHSGEATVTLNVTVG